MSWGKARDKGFELERNVFSDVTAKVLFVFILFILVQQLQFIQIFEKAKVKRLQEHVRISIDSVFRENGLGDRIPTVVVDPGNPLHQKILLTQNVLRFASGDVRLGKRDDEMILKLLGGILAENQGFMEAFKIEGHADTMALSDDIQTRYPTNWELSSGRATTVVRFLTDSTTVPPAKISSVGYSLYHPIHPDSLALNRRIEFVLQYSYSKEFMKSEAARKVFGKAKSMKTASRSTSEAMHAGGDLHRSP